MHAPACTHVNTHPTRVSAACVAHDSDQVVWKLVPPLGRSTPELAIACLLNNREQIVRSAHSASAMSQATPCNILVVELVFLVIAQLLFKICKAEPPAHNVRSAAMTQSWRGRLKAA